MRLLLSLWHSLPDAIRFAILKVVQRNPRLYRRLMFRHADLKDRIDGTRAHLPSSKLRYRVGASTDAEEFIKVGKICAADIHSAVQNVGRELESFTRILDFGCRAGARWST